MKRFIATLLLMFSLVSLSTPLAFAADEGAIKDSSNFDVFDIFSTSDEEETDADTVTKEATTKGTSPAGLIILKAINILSLLVGTFAFVMIIIGGFMFSTAGGEQNKIEKGKSILEQAVLGLVIAFFSYMIVAFIQSFFY